MVMLVNGMIYGVIKGGVVGFSFEWLVVCFLVIVVLNVFFSVVSVCWWGVVCVLFVDG